jgi:methionine salvage enolase-phosphatase E1
MYNVKIKFLNNMLFNYDTGFVDSLVYENMNDDEKNNVKKCMRKLDYELDMQETELEMINNKRRKVIGQYIHNMTP